MDIFNGNRHGSYVRFLALQMSEGKPITEQLTGFTAIVRCGYFVEMVKNLATLLIKSNAAP